MQICEIIREDAPCSDNPFEIIVTFKETINAPDFNASSESSLEKTDNDSLDGYGM
ncbi:MAG: hypothetical protein OXC62_02720 [Aestuariivita sp.]|nr:hypothetical protein [Aestuariivita sp.]